MEPFYSPPNFWSNLAPSLPSKPNPLRNRRPVPLRRIARHEKFRDQAGEKELGSEDHEQDPEGEHGVFTGNGSLGEM